MKPSRWIVRRIYPIPSPCDTLEAWTRFTHRDIPSMTRTERLRERARLQLVFLLVDQPDPWYLERWTRLEEALQHAS